MFRIVMENLLRTDRLNVELLKTKLVYSSFFLVSTLQECVSNMHVYVNGDTDFVEIECLTLSDSLMKIVSAHGGGIVYDDE